jgi:hypothetical protein
MCYSLANATRDSVCFATLEKMLNPSGEVWHKPCVRYCFTLLAALTLQLAAQPLPQQLKQALSSQLRFTPPELTSLEGGRAAARVMDTGDPEDVLIVGAIRIGATPSEFVARYRDITEFESGPGVSAVGKFSTPPHLKDVSKFALAKDEWDDFRECEPGDCSFKAGDAGLEKIRSSINWKSPNYVADANRVVQGLALEYLQNYQAKGNASLAAYHDTKKVSRVQDGLTKLVQNTPVLHQYMPDVAQYLLQYPQGKPAGSEDFFYWQVADFGLKPVHRITHVIIQQKQTPAGDGYLIANKMLYASHYFRSALELRFLLPVQTRSRTSSMYLVVLQRSYVDGLTGFKGKLLRGPIMNKSRDALERYLLSCKGKLEGGNPPAKAR